MNPPPPPSPPSLWQLLRPPSGDNFTSSNDVVLVPPPIEHSTALLPWYWYFVCIARSLPLFYAFPRCARPLSLPLSAVTPGFCCSGGAFALQRQPLAVLRLNTATFPRPVLVVLTNSSLPAFASTDPINPSPYVDAYSDCW
jgi:hypothetical protein